jgi:uncharacterized protein (TIGR02598 family)
MNISKDCGNGSVAPGTLKHPVRWRGHPSWGVSAFSLVEVVLALGIAAFALLAITGLLPVGVNTQQDSARETAAANLGTAIVSDLWQTGTTGLSARYGVDVTVGGSTVLFLDESGVPVAEPRAAYRATVWLRLPTGGAPAATCGTVTLAWPAAAPRPTGSVTLFVALDRN